jgi:hypothetical protein
MRSGVSLGEESAKGAKSALRIFMLGFGIRSSSASISSSLG